MNEQQLRDLRARFPTNSTDQWANGWHAALDCVTAASSQAKRGPCVPDEEYPQACNLAPTTHTSLDGVERCDLCGHPSVRTTA